MLLLGECSQSTGNNGILKVLLTIKSSPSSHDEYVLLNILRSRGDLKEGKEYHIAIWEKE
jgi:hypothetical protein